MNVTAASPRWCSRLLLRAGFGLGAALVVLVLSGSLGATTFSDPGGDSNGAADIASVTVTDSREGQITFRIAVAGTLASSSPNTFGIALDTDANSGTGSPDSLGADYILSYDRSNNTFVISRWNGTNWAATPYGSVRVFADTGGVTLSVNADDLGGTSAFGFRVRAIIGDPSAGQFDDAPSDGLWTFRLGEADSEPPNLRALQSSGRAGSKIHLKYEVWDDVSLTTYERIRVYRRNGDVVFTFTTARGEAEQGVDYAVVWRPPRRLSGVFRFCVESWDESTNRSAPSCARVRVRTA